MTDACVLSSPHLLHITDSLHGLQYGASQAWYPFGFKRMAGCGPTTCANLLWYLSGSRKACGALCCRENASKEQMLELMKRVWHYVTPGIQGVNKTDMLVDGAVRYAADCDLSLSARVLNIPQSQAMRPSWEAVCEFISGVIAEDLPVAFLNLSNGKVSNLEGWHWVTLVGIDPKTGTAWMYDQGKEQEINLRRWLLTTTIGGGFVALVPA